MCSESVRRLVKHNDKGRLSYKAAAWIQMQDLLKVNSQKGKRLLGLLLCYVAVWFVLVLQKPRPSTAPVGNLLHRTVYIQCTIHVHKYKYYYRVYIIIIL